MGTVESVVNLIGHHISLSAQPCAFGFVGIFCIVACTLIGPLGAWPNQHTHNEHN